MEAFRVAAPGRPARRLRPRRPQDGGAAAADLRPDAGAEVGHRHGRVRVLRRHVPCDAQGVDKIVPVGVHVPGCPPRPEALMERASSGCTRRCRPACRPRTRSMRSPSDLRRRSGVIETKRHTVEDARRRSGAPRRSLPPLARRTRLQLLGSTSLPSTTSAGAKSPSPATGGTPRAATSTRPARPRCGALQAEAQALRRQLPPAPRGAGAGEARRVRVQVWLDDGEVTPGMVASGRRPTGTSVKPGT